MSSGEVRLAGPKDALAVFDLLKIMNTETGIFSFDPDLVKEVVARLTLDRSAGILGVIDDAQGNVVATVGLSVTQGAWYTSDRTLYEIWSFVHPDHRNSSHAKNLVLFSKACAELVSAQGCPLSYTSVIKVTNEAQNKMKMYARQAVPLGTFSMYCYSPFKQYERNKSRGSARGRLVEVAS